MLYFVFVFVFVLLPEDWRAGILVSSYFPEHPIYVLFKQHLSSIKIAAHAGDVGQCATWLAGSGTTSAQSPALQKREKILLLEILYVYLIN